MPSLHGVATAESTIIPRYSLLGSFITPTSFEESLPLLLSAASVASRAPVAFHFPPTAEK
ncbi:hypothetical protein QCA50_008245 [Cerrena zonata]|uniref:Uncharacterized protein n=1 Tax=Cerrena zonata TaxID=2478898 RepID=A0AAW0GFK5_9APHY